MKLKDAYHTTAFKTEKLPIKPVQRQTNQRPPKLHKYMKKVGKKFMEKTKDINPRWTEKIPPYKGGKVAE